MHPQITPHLPQCRRLADPVSALNHDVYDQTTLLANAVRLVDHLGVEILSVEAQPYPRNNLILVRDHGQIMATLFPEAVEQRRNASYTVYVASRFGVEIRWTRATEKRG